MDNTITLNANEMSYLVTMLQYISIYSMNEVLKKADSGEEYNELMNDTFKCALHANHDFSLKINKDKIKEIEDAYENARQAIKDSVQLRKGAPLAA